jgi:STE24 endopeptidase
MDVMDKRKSWNSGSKPVERTVGRIACLAMLVCLTVACFVSAAWAQSQGGSPSDGSGSMDQTGASASDAAKQGGQSQSPAEYHLSKERYEKAVAYSRAGYALHFVSVGWGIVVLVVLLSLGVVAKLRDFAEARAKKWYWQAFYFVPILTVLLAIFDLPIGMYWHRLSLRYEQSVQSWGWWFWDWTKGELISILFSVVAALILFAAIRWKPRTWWLYFWFVAIPLAIFVVFIAPWVLDPLFNTFRPLGEKHADLVKSIGKLTERAGIPIPAERMFLMEASAKTNQINAYVTGIGASHRVVVWDNTIKKMARDEVLFVVGHELGHYALGHVWKGLVFGLAVALAGLYLAYRALQWILRIWGGRWGVQAQEDWAALAVLLLIGSVLGFLSEPVGNGFSRIEEHAADVYGLEVTHGILADSSEAAASAFQVMGELDLADPNPSRFITVWLYSHPPLAERLAFARGYDPWDKGEATRYVQ